MAGDDPKIVRGNGEALCSAWTQLVAPEAEGGRADSRLSSQEPRRSLPTRRSDVDALVDSRRQLEGGARQAPLPATPGKLQDIEQVHFREPLVPVPPALQHSVVSPLLQNSQIDLSRLDAVRIKETEAPALKLLMMSLAQTTVEVDRFDREGRRVGGLWNRLLKRPSRLNGAAALALRTWSSGDREALIRIIAACPQAVVPFLDVEAVELLSAENLAELLYWIGESTLPDAPALLGSDLEALGNLIQRYLERIPGGPEELFRTIEHLMAAVSQSGLSSTPEHVGVVFGVVLAGLVRHTRSTQQRRDRIRLAGTAFTANWWATSALFLGPWGPISSAVLVALETALDHALSQTSRSVGLATRLRGQVETTLLQNPPADWNDGDVTKAMQWMEAVLHCNGIGES